MTTRRRFGSIRKLPSGRWQAAYSAPNGKRVLAPKTFAKQADAEVWLADRRKEVDRGLWNPGATGAARTRFDAYSSRWMAARTLKPRTREQYQQIIDNHLVPHFGDRQLASITATDVRDWYAELLIGKPTARARVYSLMRTIMNQAVSDELIDSNPCRIRGAGQAQRVHTIRPASVAELLELTAAMPDRLKLAVPLASWCALRFGEMIELRRTDVDLSDEVIRVRRSAVKLTGAAGGHVIGEPKSRAGVRDVTIPPHLIEMVRAHLDEHVGPQRDSLLFPSVPGGTHHLSLSHMYKPWDKARNSAGRPDLRWHDLRHSGAVLAAQTGASLAELMSRLGHSSPQAAMRYQHVAKGRDREVAALLSKIADA